ncbi:MAG: S46 family peptidase, partial [Bacteroidota bacterium]
AIVHFGGFCTSEIISAEGLLLTNHHCGYGQIQSHSSVENNLLKNGFWAKTKADELPNEGLTATFIVRIEDVSEAILKGVTDELSSKDRQSLIDKNIDAYQKSIRLPKHEDMIIKPFFKGNQYFMFVTMTYRDVRLVGTPPESIGKFGADTDNWVFPRHTGDFSLFRIYAGPDNMPADYSENNVPFKPKHFLPISLDGVEEGDFTLVFGFPGRTNQYLPGVAVKQTMEVLNPAKIAIRDKALKIVDEAMRADEAVRIQYASKFARIANYWKKWIGENQGLESTDALGRKKRYQKDFTNQLRTNRTWDKRYGHILNDFEKLYAEIEPYALTRDYYNEVFGRNIEIMRVASYLNRLQRVYANNGVAGYSDFKDRLLNYFNGFFKDYRAEIDQKVFAALMKMYAEADIIAGAKGNLKNLAAQKGGYEQLAKWMFENSFITNDRSLFKVLSAEPKMAIETIEGDPLINFAQEMSGAYETHVAAKYADLDRQINDLQRLYMAAQMEVFLDKKFFPDANSTMRVTYGKVAGYSPKDAVTYTPVTYLDGVIEKYVPDDYEFDVSDKLLQLYRTKDYGQYADKNGKVPVCFIGTNHTTGGNSGSPAIDAHGNLVGLNFDRVWEGTMSDINYDASICRNIMVDARYILFIVDKYAGATHLIDEMKLVHPKQMKSRSDRKMEKMKEKRKTKLKRKRQ